MRIDKYLWCVRYHKTRNQASIACKKGHVKVNDIVVKPSRDVYIGDIITLRKNQINYKILLKLKYWEINSFYSLNGFLNINVYLYYK